MGIAKKECLPSTANITQIINGHGALVREYICNYAKLQEGSLCPLLRAPEYGLILTVAHMVPQALNPKF